MARKQGSTNQKKTYKDGLIEGYKKGQQDTIKIYNESEKRMKPIKEAIRRLRNLR